MNTQNYSKEAIKTRMYRHAMNYWGIKKVENLDPLVKLLLEALSSELFGLSHEIEDSHNRMLDKIRLGINKAYQEVCDTDGYVTAEKVRNAYLGLGQNHKTLLAVFKQHNEDYAKQVGKMKSERSYWKYCVVYNHLSEFIKQRYKMSDIALRELVNLLKEKCTGFAAAFSGSDEAGGNCICDRPDH